MRPLFWLIFADPPVVETSYSQELTVVMLSAEALVHLHARISASLYHEETPCRRRSPSRSSALCASTAIGPISWVDACATFFWDANPRDQKSAIKPGPNNPVGLVWIALSKEHYGIHGTPEPSRIGHAESHGCIRLTNWDAMELAGIVQPGTPALLKD